MAFFVRITVLVWADILAGFAMWVMITYLTNVWKISFTHAAGIVNIWGGIASVLPIAFSFLAETLLGNYSVLLLSSIAYSIGLGLLSMSTPPVLSSTCNEYKPECIGQTQKVLFYTALALIAVGISGHLASLGSFLNEQTTSETEDNRIETGGKYLWQLAGIFAVVLVPIIGGIALPYIKPWSIRFGIPAICTLVATLVFLGGSCSYKFSKPQGSPLTTIFRVFVASAAKISKPLPNNSNWLYEKDDTDFPSLPHTSGLRCLDKAAIISPKKAQEEQEKNKWRLCTITEVEGTKILIHMIPMWTTFIISGLVLSIGNTYFLEQANHMNRKVGHLKLPLPFFLLQYNFAKSQFSRLYTKMAKSLGRYGPPTGIAVAMAFSILCCITAAKVETRRLEVIRSHNLLDKPNDRIPMSIFWLLPQFTLLAALDGISERSIAGFFAHQAPPSLKRYLVFFTNGVFGLGIMSSVLSVYIVEKVRPSWFRYTLNKSRLDNYYWTLSALSGLNLVLYMLVACLYSYRESDLEDEEVAVHGSEFPEPFEENVKNCCCC